MTIDVEQALATDFDEQQASTLARVMTETHATLVDVSDFSELKRIVQALAVFQERLSASQGSTDEHMHALVEAQARTDARIDTLTKSQIRTEQALNQLTEGHTETRQWLAELAQAQQRTEQALQQLPESYQQLATEHQETRRQAERTQGWIEELAQAQSRTEQALQQSTKGQQETRHWMAELAQAQSRTEQALQQLTAEHQETRRQIERTQGWMAELAQAQSRTEHTLQQLTESHQQLTAEHQELTEEHRKTRQQMGGLSMTVGYRLEDDSYKALPRLLKQDYGLVVQGRLRRGYVQDNRGNQLEVNILGEAHRDGQPVTIIGESKSQLSKNHIESFLKRRLRLLEGVFEHIFPILITYMITSPDVEEYARSQGIALYYSYDF